MQRAPRPRPRDGHGQGGFTLLEMIVAIAVLSAIITPLTASFVEMMNRTGEVDAELARTADAQRIGAAWTRDVQSVEPGGINQAGTCADRTPATVVEEHLITFSWGSSSTASGGLRTASWVAVGSGEEMELVRRECLNGVPVGTTSLADHIGQRGQSAIAVVHGPVAADPRQFCPAIDKGTAVAPRMISDACTIEVEGSFAYELTATRRVAERDVAGPAATPPPPPTIDGAGGRNTYVTVSWTPPSAWSPPIDGFRAHVYTDPDGSAVASVEVDGTSNAATIGGLTNGTPYFVRVQSHNSIGWGELSAAWGPVTPNPTVPDPVTAVVATPGGVGAPTTVDLVWSLPTNDGGSAIDRVRIVPRTATGTELAATEVAGTPSGHTVTGLAPGTRYTFVVSVHNALGWNVGTESNLTGTRPPKPSAVQVSPGDARVNVSFELGGNGDISLASGAVKAVRIRATCVTAGNGCVDREVLFAHPNPSAPNGAWGPFSTASASPAVSLVNGRDYRVQVDVQGSLGEMWGPASDPVTVRPTRIPDAPSGITIVSTGTSQQLSFTISEPDAGGDPIATYRITHVGTDKVLTVPYTGPQTSVTWSSLSPTSSGTVTLTDFVDQGFRLQACNALGCSALSPQYVAMPGPTPVTQTFTAARGSLPQSAVLAYAGTAATTHPTATRWVLACGAQTATGTGASGSSTVTNLPTGTQTCTAQPSNRLTAVIDGAPTQITTSGPPASATVDIYTAPGAFSAAIDLPATGVVNNVTVRAVTPPSTGGPPGGLTYSATCSSSPGSGSGGPTSTNGVAVSGLTQGNTASCTLTATNAAGYSSTATVSRKLVRMTPEIALVTTSQNLTVSQSGANASHANRLLGVVRVRMDPGLSVTGMQITFGSTTPSGGYLGAGDGWSVWKTETNSTYQDVFVWIDRRPADGNWPGIGSTRAVQKNAAFRAQVSGDANVSPGTAATFWTVAEWQDSGDEDLPAVYETSSTFGGTRAVGAQFTAQYKCDDNDGSGQDECDSVRLRLRRVTDGAVVALTCTSGCETRDGPTDGIFNADDNTSRSYNLPVPANTGPGRYLIELQGCNEGGQCPYGAPGGYSGNSWQAIGYFDVP